MKTHYKLLLAILSIGILSFTGCSSDNDDVIEVKEQNLIIEGDEFTAKIGEITKINILEGNGDYNAFADHPEKLQITSKDNYLELEGLETGTTNLYITDQKMEIQKVKVYVIKSEVITLENDLESLEFTVKLGNVVAKAIKIVEGNDLYKVKHIDNTDLIRAHIENDELLVIATQRGNEGGEANVVIEDQGGLTKTIKVKVTSTDIAFTEDELSDILNLSNSKNIIFIERFLDQNYKYSYSRKIKRTNIQAKKVITQWWSSYTSSIEISFDNIETTGKASNAKLKFSNYPQQHNESEVDIDLNIIQNDDECIKGAFSYMSGNVLMACYFVSQK